MNSQFFRRIGKTFELLPLLLCASSIICIGTLSREGSASILLNENSAGRYLIASLMLRLCAAPIVHSFYWYCRGDFIRPIPSWAAAIIPLISIKICQPQGDGRSLLSVAKWSILLILHNRLHLDSGYPPKCFPWACGCTGRIHAADCFPVLGALFAETLCVRGALFGLWAGSGFFLTAALTSFKPAIVCSLGAGGQRTGVITI